MKTLKEEPLSRHTSFRVGGPAEEFVQAEEAEAIGVIRACRREGRPLFLLGKGTNLLVSDAGLPGVVLQLLPGEIRISGETLTVPAGNSLRQAAEAACEAGLSGLEFSYGIPGTVGGAVVMNAGAYGSEIKEVLTSVRLLTAKDEVKEIPAERLDLSYRHSNIRQEGAVVLSATFHLTPRPQDLVRLQMEEVLSRRREKQPLEYPSAGSTFKRPPGQFAGKLIQDCGLKGRRIGGAAVSEKHAGFIVNLGDATAYDIYLLIRDVRRVVQEETGVELEPEVLIVGDF